jgi:acylglycerol lipase
MAQTNGKYLGCDDVKIFWQSWQAENPIAVVVISHGLGEHGGRYGELASALVGLNYTVYAIDHRGHGQSYGHRGSINRFQYCVDDLNQLIDKVSAEHQLPVLLLGHSMGGAIAVEFTLQHQEKLSALLLSGAGLSVDVVNMPIQVLCGVLSMFIPNLPSFAVAPDLVSRDSSVVKDYFEDPLNLSSRIPLKTISELVNKVKKLPAQFSSISLPILIMHGREDKLVPASSSEALFDRVGSTDKEMKIYPGLYHEILNELPTDRQQVINDICEWIVGRFRA